MLRGEEITVTIKDESGEIYSGTLTMASSGGIKSSEMEKKVIPQKRPLKRTTNKSDIRYAVEKMIDVGFLDDWHTYTEVWTKLKTKGFGFSRAAVRMTMLRMARDGSLDRERFKEGNKYVYKYKKP